MLTPARRPTDQLRVPSLRSRPREAESAHVDAQVDDDVLVETLSVKREDVVRLGRPGRSAPDHRLVARVRAGDERAFEAIFDRYHRPLLAFCRHMLGSREEAEDALQHVFVSAHRHLVSRDEVVELRPWLYAIARNRCLSALRARRDAVALDDVPEPSVEGLSVAGEVEQRQDLKEVLADLARLPDDQRAALVLSELGALSHDEIGAVLGVRRDKVKALVFQARESLAAYRAARGIDCREIREQLANLRGGALRRGPLRRHLETCEGCRGFRDEVRRQREAMALLLPVVPTIALKAKVIGAVTASSASMPASIGAAGLAGGAVSAGVSGGSAATGGLAGLGGSFVAKSLVVAAVAGTAGGGYVVVESVSGPRDSAPPARLAPAPGEPPAPAGRVSSPAPALPATGTPTGVDADRGVGRAEGKHKDKAGNGRGNADRAEKAGGKRRADKATPGVAPVVADAPGQAKKDEPKQKTGKPATAGPPSQRPAKVKDRPHGKPDGNGPPAAKAGPTGKAPPAAPKASPRKPKVTSPSASADAAAPSAASARPEGAGKPDDAGKPDQAGKSGG